MEGKNKKATRTVTEKIEGAEKDIWGICLKLQDGWSQGAIL